jgi:hypothetical protein
MMKIVVVSSGLLLFIAYLFGAFIQMDWVWIHGMFTTWGPVDRAGFAINTLCIGFLGGALGALLYK